MIGIVGGVGPYAGIDLLKKVFDNTVANSDQEHLDAVLLSVSSKIDDRTEYLTGKINRNPGIAIAEVLLKLKNVGATVAGIPCNTAHADEIFTTIKNELSKQSNTIKVLNMIEETASCIALNYPHVSKVGVLSTTGTYNSKIYPTALHKMGFEVLVPPMEMQEDLIHPAIYHSTYGIKTISNPIHSQAKANLLEGFQYLKEQGAEAVVLGCTEIPLAFNEERLNDMILIDPTTILARALIQNSKPEKLKTYRNQF